MSYMRGPDYVWRDDERVHFWSSDGSDGWKESTWADGLTTAPSENSPSGMALRQHAVDHYVAMRLAELVREGRLSAVIDEAISRYKSDGGCLALVDLGPALAEALDRIPRAKGISG